MKFSRLNVICGWIVGIIACTVFILTREATASFWDCGEFIPCAYKLEISHPPGAPLFILLGRIFIILFSGSWDATKGNPNAAVQVNLLSSMSSGFTILFLYWNITHIARRLVLRGGEVLTTARTWAILGAGAVGALAFTFSDSFWFSAVEGIVFGVSPLFISIAFWAILKWEEAADEPGADRWIVFIAFIIGLSIGVHLLSLLSIPAIVMTYYFRRYKYSRKGALLAFLLAIVLTGVVQILVIQDTVRLIGWFDLQFVNSFHLPFNSGACFCILLIAAGIVFGIIKAGQRGWYYLKLGLWCLAFILVGYSSYFIILIRANAKPAINMQDVNNPIELVAYLDRSQYGTWPVLYGPDFTAQPTGRVDKGNIYYKNASTGRYDVVGKKFDYDYAPEDKHLFTRAWDSDNSLSHVTYYQQWLGLGDKEKPTIGDHMRWLISWQFNWMYWRYFMWNFAGRQNDLQGLGNPRDGNWISGIPFLDNMRLGDQSTLPDTLQNNKAHNKLFLLPLLLGVLGLVYHWKKDRHNFSIVFLLYFFTGIAIILYLNQYGPQPRERDYSYVGSFYAFSIWIGLGVLYVFELFQKKIAPNAAAVAASGLCLLAVPLLMCSQEWDDHDRSAKTLARDAAANYLQSCAPNAILFTGGDNDTYPLWYAQEVENIRPDVRVIVTSLLSTDWDINQLRTKVNQSAPLPITWSPDKYLGEARNYIPFYDPGKLPQDRYFDLGEVMNFMVDDNNQVQSGDGTAMSYMPVKKFFVPVDKQAVLRNGTVALNDSAHIVSPMTFTYPGNGLYKNDAIILNVLAANKWQRPLYFTFPGNLGLNDYLVQEGLTYRLSPVSSDKSQQSMGGEINEDKMYENLLTKFKWGGADKPDIYFDENGRRTLLTLRRAFTSLGISLATSGKKDSARKVLDYGYQKLDPSTMPYGLVSNGPSNVHDITSMQFAYACMLAGDQQKAGKIAAEVIKDCKQQEAYYTGLPESMQGYFQNDLQTARAIINQLQSMQAEFNKPASLEGGSVIDSNKH